MKILFDETHTSNDGKHTSRNIWYGYADISVDAEYGKIIELSEDFTDHLCELIKKDLSENKANSPTETNWYFYGSTVTKDAIGDTIRPTIMVREKSDEFVTNITISDYDFAVNLDAIQSFKSDFEKRLASL